MSIAANTASANKRKQFYIQVAKNVLSSQAVPNVMNAMTCCRQNDTPAKFIPQIHPAMRVAWSQRSRVTMRTLRLSESGSSDGGSDAAGRKTKSTLRKTRCTTH